MAIRLKRKTTYDFFKRFFEKKKTLFYAQIQLTHKQLKIKALTKTQINCSMEKPVDTLGLQEGLNVSQEG